jgi:hypothetical protein
MMAIENIVEHLSCLAASDKFDKCKCADNFYKLSLNSFYDYRYAIQRYTLYALLLFIYDSFILQT